MFSPYYAWARNRGAADPLQHCALNVALYGRSASRWAMTERGAASVQRSAAMLAIGPSALHWDGNSLCLEIEERCMPVPRRLRGRIRLHPSVLPGRGFAIDARGRHRWTPYAPLARVEVELSEPALAWSGAGYLDSNRGSEPLERAFRSWHWSRACGTDGTRVLYDTRPIEGAERSLALRFGSDGAVEHIEAPPSQSLPRTGWRIERVTRADAGHAARVSQTLEDAPFYSRSLLATHLGGEPVAAIHESLDLERFRTRWVRLLLPFRMPRIAR